MPCQNTPSVGKYYDNKTCRASGDTMHCALQITLNLAEKIFLKKLLSSNVPAKAVWATG